MSDERAAERIERPSRVFVVSGPSGVGKNTIVTRICTQGLAVRAVTATSRPPRGHERNGEDYSFLSDAEFDRWIAEGKLLEHVRYCGHQYGTPIFAVNSALSQGLPVLLVIDVQGALQIKESCPEISLIFIAAPSEEKLEQRIRARGLDDEEQIAERLRRAREELAFAERYDHVVVNDVLERAVAEVTEILQTENPGS